jgi:hypothetical protein
MDPGEDVLDGARPGGERATGIEPASSAWEADILPLNYARGAGSGYQRSAVGAERWTFIARKQAGNVGTVWSPPWRLP